MASNAPIYLFEGIEERQSAVRALTLLSRLDAKVDAAISSQRRMVWAFADTLVGAGILGNKSQLWDAMRTAGEEIPEQEFLRRVIDRSRGAFGERLLQIAHGMDATDSSSAGAEPIPHESMQEKEPPSPFIQAARDAVRLVRSMQMSLRSGEREDPRYGGEIRNQHRRVEQLCVFLCKLGFYRDRDSFRLSLVDEPGTKLPGSVFDRRAVDMLDFYEDQLVQIVEYGASDAHAAVEQSEFRRNFLDAVQEIRATLEHPAKPR